MTFVIHPQHSSAFSLVEVVLALGIFVFAGFALIGVLSIGVQSNRDSREQLQAANIAEFICATRRAAPVLDVTTNQPGFPLPVLNLPSGSATYSTNNFASPTYLTWDGTATNSISAARFGLIYNIVSVAPYTNRIYPGSATLYLCLYWPAQAPVADAAGHFEVTSTFALP